MEFLGGVRVWFLILLWSHALRTKDKVTSRLVGLRKMTGKFSFQSYESML